MSLTVRDARPGDLPAIVSIYNAAVPGRKATADTAPVTVRSRRDWVTAHSPARRPIWVADEDGVVLGWLSFQSFYGRAAYAATAELSVYVAPAAHRRGIGRGLVERAVKRAPDIGLEVLLGFIFAHNDASLNLFEACGFERWGHLPKVARLDSIVRDLVIVGRSVRRA